MSQNILLVEDEVEVAHCLKDYLAEKKYNVLMAHSVGDAFKLISDHKIALILSDIRMPGKTGLDLFREYKEKIDIKNTTPFVLMTGFADIISVENAFKIGINDLIAKPYDLEAISLVVDYLLNSEHSLGPANENYFAVNIEEIILSKTSDYDIFLKIHDKYVRVTKSGQDYTPLRLDNFAKKGATHIYLKTKDFAKYTDLQFAVADSVIKRPMDEVKKIRFMNQLMSSISQNSIINQIDKQYLDQSLQAFEAYTQLALNHSQLNNILSIIHSENPDLTEQITLKAIMACSIANLWKWTNPKVQSRIILSALLSDVGLKDYKHLISKKRFEYTAEEIKQYERHPILSYELLKQIDDIPIEILQVAMQHHENALGLGFPQKLPRSKIHSYSKLIHGIDVFIDTVLIQEDKSDIKKTLDQIYKIERKSCSEQVIKSLYILFRVEMPKALRALLLPSDTTRVV